MVAIGMITYTVLAQSFLTFILRVGVWFISLIGLLEYKRDGGGASLALVTRNVIGQIGGLFFPPFLSLLGCSFVHFYKTVRRSLTPEGVLIWVRKESVLFIFLGGIDLWVSFSVHNRVGLRSGLISQRGM